MANCTKPKSGDDTDHYHVWSGPTAGEVTVLRKGPTFKTRRSALSWLRERCGELAKVLICRDAACPALDLGDDVASPPGDATSQPDPSPESSRSPDPSPAPEPRTRRRPAPQPGGSPF